MTEKKPEPETDGTVPPIDENEHKIISDILMYLHQDKEHIECVVDKIYAELCAVIHAMYASLETDVTVRIYLSPEFKSGVGHIKIRPPADIEFELSSIKYPVFIEGRTVMVDMPSLVFEQYNIPYKYIEDIQIKAGDKNYSLFDMTNGRIAFDLYREWFVSNDAECQTSNLIHVDFKNHPSKKGY